MLKNLPVPTCLNLTISSRIKLAPHNGLTL
jgi:hypothetical protein